MDFTKLISLISSKKIFLAKASTFEDPYEGSLTEKDREEYLKGDLFLLGHQSNLLAEELKSETFISCWHMNEHESAGMWNLYTKTNESIAIVSTYKQLKNSIQPLDENNYYIGKVNYLDYSQDNISNHKQNALSPFFHKRLSFKHEEEVRVIGYNNKANTVVLGVNREKLINYIYINPQAPKWFFNLVKKIINDDYELKDIEIIQSDLYRNIYNLK